MKSFIENSIKEYSILYSNAADVLTHLFTAIGNGIRLNSKGYIRGTDMVQVGDEFDYTPTQLRSVYPWDDNIAFQPFRKYKGCRNRDFKKAVKYFIDCIELTPNSVVNIKEWKDNTHILKEVLLDSDTITDKYKITDLTKFLESMKKEELTWCIGERAKSSVMKYYKCCDIKYSESVDYDYLDTLMPDLPEEYLALYDKGLFTIFADEHFKGSDGEVGFFDPLYSDCPQVVQNELRSLWQDYYYGNDTYCHKVVVDEDFFSTYPLLYFWLTHKGFNNKVVYLHYWW